MSKTKIQTWLPLEAMLAASQMGGDVVRIFPIRRIGKYGLAILRYDHVMKVKDGRATSEASEGAGEKPTTSAQDQQGNSETREENR